MADTYTIPSYIKDAIIDMGYSYPMGAMQAYIEEWYAMLRADGEFWDYNSTDGGVRRHIHRRTIHPAARVANEWASLIFNDRMHISTEDEAANEWLGSLLESERFKAHGQGLVKRAFALGTGAWALRYDGSIHIDRYDARMTVPLSWDDGGVWECAFASQVSHGGRRLDQLQMHVVEDGTYHIISRFWDADDGSEVSVDDVEPDFDTRCERRTFAIVKPAIENTRADLSPYGQSIYAEAEDALRDVDLCYDAVMNEVELTKARIFISDVMVEYTTTDSDGSTVTHKNALPFGKDDATIYRKVQSSDDMIQTYAPSMRTGQQLEAYRMALQTMGDLCGFGLQYFDVDKGGGVKTATEVSADNSALMRNIRKHENLLEDSVADICHAALQMARALMGETIPDEGRVTVAWDDSIITDTAAEKAQDMAELNITLNPWEYRMKWYGEDEETARAKVPGSAVELPIGD